MKNQSIVIAIPVITLLCAYMYNNIDASEFRTAEYANMIYASGDTTEFDQEKALEQLREKIAGKEDQPASEVFENIKVFKKVPAGRMLRIMEMGFTRSLGVNCTHCHNPKDWASEEKDQKQIARDMMAMSAKINNELLTSIKNLDSEKPTVNCTTCHRGEVKPATNLED